MPPPGWLSPRQALAWIEIVQAAPWLRPIDAALLGALVVCRDLHRQAAEAVMQDGMTVTGISGAEIAHPALKVVAQQALLSLRLSEALAMTPSARRTLGISGGEPLTSTDDDGEPRETLQQWLARRPSPKLH